MSEKSPQITDEEIQQRATAVAQQDIRPGEEGRVHDPHKAQVMANASKDYEEEFVAVKKEATKSQKLATDLYKTGVRDKRGLEDLNAHTRNARIYNQIAQSSRKSADEKAETWAKIYRPEDRSD